MTAKQKVILYSTSLHAWEVWSQSRPLCRGDLAACQDAHPDALPVSDRQRVIEVGDRFSTERPWLRDSDAVLDRCVQVSEEFVALLADAGVDASVVDGILLGTTPEFPDTPLVLAGHYAVLVTLNGTDTVYDWTARQFDPTAPVPLVQPLTTWRETWRDLAKTGATA